MRKVVIGIFYGSFVAGCGLLLTVAVWRYQAANVVSDGIYFAGVDLGGVEITQVEQEIDKLFDRFLDQSVMVGLAGEFEAFAYRDLGVGLQKEETVERILRLAKGDDLGQFLQTQILLLRGKGIRIKPKVVVDEEIYVNALQRRFVGLNEARDAELVWTGGGEVEVRPALAGVSTKFEQFSSDLVVAAENMSDDTSIVLKPRKMRVSYPTKDAEGDAEILRRYLNQMMVIRDSGGNFSKEFMFPQTWIKVYKGEVQFDRELISSFLLSEVAPEVDLIKSDLEIVAMPEEEVGYVEVAGDLSNGRVMHVDKSLDLMLQKLEVGDFEIDLVMIETPAQVKSLVATDLGEMVLLAEGRSNFAGSTAGRAFNVNKGLNEKMNNIVVAPGAEFSFNSFLGPVTYGAGWEGALAIFNGKDLRPVPGGGLCQVSTTIYRAALNSGLKITEKRNHSMYIHYYREHGNGLDATIYPGQQDLKFINDTENYILVRAYVDGDDAFVDFYGTPDGRKVDLEGPFYKGQIPEKYQEQIQLGPNQIAWMHRVTYANGEQEERILKSSYRNAIQR